MNLRLHFKCQSLIILLSLCQIQIKNVASRPTVLSIKFKKTVIEDQAFDLDKIVEDISRVTYLHNHGQIGLLKGHYLLEDKSEKCINEALETLNNHNLIDWHKFEIILKRVKRNAKSPLSYLNDNFKDPLLNDQWHLFNKANGVDCNVTGVWEKNITGKGVVVAIVDDGVEWKHPDLIDNYCHEGSFDLNSNDKDPTPVFDHNGKNKHGTRCAGEVAASPNSVCGVGIAFGSKFSGIRVIDGPTTDATEAIAFNKHMDVNDIYSCSWGPDDDGKTVEGPHRLGISALEHGVVAGRKGFGSIFVVASGNGGREGDNCNYDGYANSIYTITIGALNEFGKLPDYSESCTSMMACTVSNGGAGRGITTTDWSFETSNKEQCTNDFTGTSAATPLVAGMIALMLEARPCLTWRDVQHIIAYTAQQTINGFQFGQNDFVKNAAGFYHSNAHGFGFLDSWRLVNAARAWQSVPWFTSLKIRNLKNESNIEVTAGKKNPLVIHQYISKQTTDEHLINSLEFVLLSVTIKHSNRGKLSFEIQCPSGTQNIIPGRVKDKSPDGFTHWVFSSVKCWGETPFGTYTIKITDGRGKTKDPGTLVDWSLTLYGSQLTQSDIEQRRHTILNAMSGENLSSDYYVNCSAGIPLDFDVTTAIQDRTLKLLVMLACFFLFWAIYYSIEMTFCNSEDKKKSEPSTEETIENQDVAMNYGVDNENSTATNSTSTDPLVNNPVFTTIDLQENNDTAAIILPEELPAIK